ncbi:MAG: class I SAM-dependent methyltransferase family protein [Methanothrix sp.]|nr:MAG: class I SAM-dependent methyltransferase family protein [Methanothrix sp.]
MSTSAVSRGIKVKRSYGERFRKALVETGAFDAKRKIRSDDSNIFLPVHEIDDEAAARLRLISDFEFLETEFLPEEHFPTPEELLGFRPSFEIVGDIAIAEEVETNVVEADAGAAAEAEGKAKAEGEATTDNETKEEENADAQQIEQIASALMATNRSIRTVIVPISDVEGEFRTRRFRHVAGEERTTTIHKEHGLRYRIDLQRAYFTPRLGTERLRVAKQIRQGDTVLDMFAGVGPFAFLMAKKGARVIAMDKNPVAVKYMRENARLNKIEDIEILEGDANELALSYADTADHVIMNLPHSASQFLIPAMKAAKSGGIIHYYAISPEDALYGDWAMIAQAAERVGAKAEVVYQGVVRSYAPHRLNVVIDFRVDKSQKGLFLDPPQRHRI